MPVAASEIERLILATCPDAKVEIQDLAGDNNHWAATVVDESFRGKNRVQQQRMVNAALSEILEGHWDDVLVEQVATDEIVTVGQGERITFLRLEMPERVA